MSRRSQFIPWRVAGRVTDEQDTADEVVRATGWVFNGVGADSLAEFVATGDVEVPRYLDAFGMSVDTDRRRAIVEIGSGIGRMTCALTRRFATVYACDLDAGFLERCREAVGRFGQLSRLRTVPVPDGRTLEIPDGVADVAFSYITLQHCDRRDALALVSEAIRVVRPGGAVVLNFRMHTASDAAVLPLGALTRGLYRVPGLGQWISRHRLPSRLAWQAHRLDPHHVLQPVQDRLATTQIWRNTGRTSPIWGAGDAEMRYLDVINRAHWWLVATRADPANNGPEGSA